MIMTHILRRAPLIIALCATVVASACGKSGDRSSQPQPGQEANEAMIDSHDETPRDLAMSFADARKDPKLIRGDARGDIIVDCNWRSARLANDSLRIRLTSSRYGSWGYFSLGTPTSFVNVYADFIESADRSERIFFLTHVVPQTRVSKDFRLDHDLVVHMADVVQSLHKRCFANSRLTPTSYLLVSPKLSYR